MASVERTEIAIRVYDGPYQSEGWDFVPAYKVNTLDGRTVTCDIQTTCRPELVAMAGEEAVSAYEAANGPVFQPT